MHIAEAALSDSFRDDHFLQSDTHRLCNLRSGSRPINLLRNVSSITSKVAQGGATMSNLIWLSEAQMRRNVSGIIFVLRNGLRWHNAPAAFDPHKTIHIRFIRWGRVGVFNKVFPPVRRATSLTG